MHIDPRIGSYFISVGGLQKMYTLRQWQEVFETNDYGVTYSRTVPAYIMTLSNNRERALERARAWCSNSILDESLINLTLGEIKRNHDGSFSVRPSEDSLIAKRDDIVSEAVEKIEDEAITNGVMAFGKYEGLTPEQIVTEHSDVGYLLWVVNAFESSYDALVKAQTDAYNHKLSEERLRTNIRNVSLKCVNYLVAKSWVENNKIDNKPHVGEVGESIEIVNAKIVGSVWYEVDSVYVSSRCRVEFVDADGNRYVTHTTGSFADNHVGDVIPLVKAKIKSHKVENGLNYNIVSHVKVPKEKKPKSK